MGEKSEKSLCRISQNLGGSTYADLRARETKEVSTGKSIHWRRTPLPTIPVAPVTRIFIEQKKLVL
jgi:hypothetical protein